jgi:hypothetical protein
MPENYHAQTTCFFLIAIGSSSSKLANHLSYNLGSSCLQADVAKFEGFPVINNICPHTNPELLLV